MSPEQVAAREQQLEFIRQRRQACEELVGAVAYLVEMVERRRASAFDTAVERTKAAVEQALLLGVLP